MRACIAVQQLHKGGYLVSRIYLLRSGTLKKEIENMMHLCVAQAGNARFLRYSLIFRYRFSSSGRRWGVH